MKKLLIIILLLLFFILFFSFKSSKLYLIDIDHLNSIIINPIKIIGNNDDQMIYLYKNYDAKFDNDGKIYIVDGGNNRIVILNSNWHLIKTIGRRGSGPGEFNNPLSIAINNNNIFVNDQGNGRVQIFDKEFNYIDTIFPGLHFIAGFVADNFGNLYVNSILGTTEKDHLIKVFSSIKPYKLQRSFLNVIKHKIGEPGNQELMNLLCLDVDENGNLYVAFCSMPLVSVFNKNGEEIYRYNFKGKIVDKLKEKPPGGHPKSAYEMFSAICSPRANELYLSCREGIINIIREKNITKSRMIKLINKQKNKESSPFFFSFDIYNNFLIIPDLIDYTIKIYRVPPWN